MLILGVSGAFSCYQLAANTMFVQATPHECRSGAFGLAQGGMSLGQGIMMLIAGAAAQRYSPAIVIAACGALGTAVAVILAASASARQRRESSQALPGLLGPSTGAHGDTSLPSPRSAHRSWSLGPSTGAHARHLLSLEHVNQRPLY
jgi:MFS family permease